MVVIRTKEFLQYVDVLWMMCLRMMVRQGKDYDLVSGEAPKGGVCDVSHKHSLLQQKNEERQRAVFVLGLPDDP